MYLRETQAQTIAAKQKTKLIPQMRIASFLELPEPRFVDFVAEVENSALFQRLLSPLDETRKVISYKRFPHAGLYLNTMELFEGATRDTDPGDVESLLVSRSEVAEIIRTIGIKKFKRFFLDNEEGTSIADISALCSIPEKDVIQVNNLVTDMSIHNEFYSSSKINFAAQLNYHKVAMIEPDGAGDFFIKFYSPRYSAGKYIVDDTKLKSLKAKNVFTAAELGELNSLLGKIELINERKTTLYQILSRLINKQKPYMNSGDARQLCAYTQRELAADIGFDTSTASRAIDGRSIETPQGEEKPLQFFCPSKKDIRKNIINEICGSHLERLTDMDIKCTLKKTFGLDISRRTVNVCRNELNSEGRGGK